MAAAKSMCEPGVWAEYTWSTFGSLANTLINELDPISVLDIKTSS